MLVVLLKKGLKGNVDGHIDRVVKCFVEHQYNA